MPENVAYFRFATGQQQSEKGGTLLTESDGQIKEIKKIKVYRD